MAILKVTTSADAVNAGDGKLSLREAVAQANSLPGADTIQFASGLEGTTLVLTRGELVLRRDVTIDGDRNDDGVAVTLSGGDTQRILSTSGGGTDVTLNDLTLTHGYAGLANNGGAVFAGGSSLSLDGCAVTNSVSLGYGGGVYVAGGRLSVTNSIISDNKSEYYNGGGGIASKTEGVIKIDNSILARNEAYNGGAIDIGLYGTLRISNSLIIDNEAFDEGGGIRALESKVFCKQSVISSNSVGGADYAYGGGIAVFFESTLTIQGCAISDNQANDGGGGIFSSGSATSISRSTIYGNYTFDAGSSGGGIYGGGGIINITDTTITNNNSRSGVDDFGSYGGGGIATNTDFFPVQLSIYNTIVAGNRTISVDPSLAENPDIFGPITASNGHNLFGSTVEGAVAGDHEGIDPLLLFANVDPATGGGLPDDNGGPTPTVALWDDPANPALGGADPAMAGATDQRGVVRPRPVGSDPDIGAFELAQSFAAPASKLFDGLEYIASYTDLIRAFGPNEAAGTSHYRFFGSDEGRSVTFDGLEYIASYADLIRAFGPDRDAGSGHFIEFGAEERRSPDDFDAEQYLANYADLQAAYGDDTEAATRHFITNGFAEGRTDEKPGALTAGNDFLF